MTDFQGGYMSSPHEGECSSSPQRTFSNGTQPSSVQKRPVAEIIAERFPPFDHRSAVVSPFEEEAKRDAIFQQELSKILLNVILQSHAWASVRPTHESNISASKLEQQIKVLLKGEQEQGRFLAPSSSYPCRFVELARDRLAKFIAQMRSALAALTGL